MHPTWPLERLAPLRPVTARLRSADEAQLHG
jgi:hypothetical protein